VDNAYHGLLPALGDLALDEAAGRGAFLAGFAAVLPRARLSSVSAMASQISLTTV
jgi:hypothetical protein